MPRPSIRPAGTIVYLSSLSSVTRSPFEASYYRPCVTRASSLDLSPRFKELSMANARPNRSRASRDPSPDSLLERSFSPARSSGLRSSLELETPHSAHFPDHFRFIQAPTILASPFPRRYLEDPTSRSTSSSLDARDARDH